MSDPWDNPSAYEGWQADLIDATAHKHRFTIPVKWETIPSHFELTNPKNGAGVNHPERTTVTRLRCECGEETNR